jgi:hypothetical protein
MEASREKAEGSEAYRCLHDSLIFYYSRDPQRSKSVCFMIQLLRHRTRHGVLFNSKDYISRELCGAVRYGTQTLSAQKSSSNVVKRSTHDEKER